MGALPVRAADWLTNLIPTHMEPLGVRVNFQNLVDHFPHDLYGTCISENNELAQDQALET